MLVAKAVHEGWDTLLEEEQILLFLIFDYLDMLDNYDWVTKKMSNLIKIRPLIIYLRNIIKHKHLEGQTVLEQSAVLPMKHGVLPNKFEYFGWKTFYKIESYIHRISYGKIRNKRPKRFIGVGYKDHGNMKKMEVDGTPSWQEVASSDLDLPPNPKETCTTYKLIWTEWGYRQRE